MRTATPFKVYGPAQSKEGQMEEGLGDNKTALVISGGTIDGTPSGETFVACSVDRC